MPRQPRDDQVGLIYHALHRGNQRQMLIHIEDDFVAFERVLFEGLAKYPVELFAYTRIGSFYRWKSGKDEPKLQTP